MPATYDGIPIFGVGVKIKTAVNPPSDQKNAFFGVNGQESLFGGTRGRLTLASGTLFGEDLGTLRAVEEGFASYVDGVARNLTDTGGVTYQFVKLNSFEPVSDRIIQDSRGCWREYRATFEHLT